MATGIQTKPEPWCPDCGARMKLIRPRKGQDWKPFWGCTEYKYGCRGKREIGPDGRPMGDDGQFMLVDFCQDY